MASPRIKWKISDHWQAWDKTVTMLETFDDIIQDVHKVID